MARARWRGIGRWLLIALGVLFCASAPAMGQRACLAPGDSSVSQVESLTGIMRAGATSSATVRSVVGIAALDTTDMHLVIADSVCARIDSVMMRSAVQPAVVRRWVVYRLGLNRFAVFSPGPSFTTVFFIDDRNKVVAMLH